MLNERLITHMRLQNRKYPKYSRIKLFPCCATAEGYILVVALQGQNISDYENEDNSLIWLTVIANALF